MGKLSVKGLAVALGAAWSLCILFAGWAAMFGWCTEFVQVMASIYIGYAPTFSGAVIGAIWGFLDGAGGLSSPWSTMPWQPGHESGADGPAAFLP